MNRSTTYSKKGPNAVALSNTSGFVQSNVRTRERGPLAIILYAYYGFVFTVPFESVGFADDYLSLSKIAGLLFGLTACLSPRVCFRRPPKAFWYFIGYLGIVTLMIPFQESAFTSLIISRLLTMTQLFILFWISYNLMGDERVVKRTLLTLIIACTVLATLVLLGIGGGEFRDRDTALGANPNMTATVLSFGLLALSGLAFGRQKGDFKALLLMGLCSGILAIEIVRTGSRGSVIAIIVAFMAFPLKRTKRLISKFGLVLTGALAVSFLVWTSYRSESVRERWESTFATGETAGRDAIFSEAWGMFLERPLFGWGPITHLRELGSRLGLRERDPHNLYLWVLTETGMLGAIPFFVGLWLCLMASWKARNGPQGVLPLALLLCLLINNMKGTLIDSKLFWIVLAYALAGATQARYNKWHKGLPRGSQLVGRRPVGFQVR